METVKKARKACFLLALCVILAEAWTSPVITVRAKEMPAETEVLDTQQPEEPGFGEKEPDDGDASGTVTVTASARLTKTKKAAFITWKRVKGASAYKVQRSSKKEGGFKKIASLPKSGLSYKDVKVERGSRYYYRVAAKMEDGSTCYSEAVALFCPLGEVSGVKLIRYSTSSIKVTWDKSRDRQAKWYKVYYAKTKNGKYNLAGITDRNWYRVKKLKKYQSYYFRVEACAAKESSGLDSGPSKTVTMVTRPYERLTVFAGDSLTRGIKSYGALGKIHIGGKKAVVAVDGLNTLTFRTKKVINGLSAMNEVIRLQPYRVYIMLGGNDIHYCDKADLIKRYRIILNEIQSRSPDTDIVVLAMSPVTAATKNRLTGFKQIPAYNKDLKALAEEMGARFYDCTGFMKDSTGWLKSAYATKDGIHWKAPVYDEYVKLLEAYDKSLDK